jgi:hypothetical protein
MKYEIKATLTFDCEIDQDVSDINQLAEEMELSFTAPEGCKLKITDNEFVIIGGDGEPSSS